MSVVRGIILSLSESSCFVYSRILFGVVDYLGVYYASDGYKVVVVVLNKFNESEVGG